MNILAWILFGAIAGWIASVIMKSNESPLMDIVLGIVGAFVGGLVMNFFGEAGVTGFNLYSMVVAVVGAVVVISLGRMMRGSAV